MDAFFAAIEQRDRPELAGLPVVVGGSPTSRGVVSTASYEARRHGIRSAMPSSQARRLCPDAVFIRPDIARYREVSRQVREVFLRYTDLVEPLSLDEAFLDVTTNKQAIPSATWAADAIRADIRRETGLTASAGVAPNKFLAKVASDMNKPDGLVVVPPDEVEAFVRDLPVRRIPGVGPVTGGRCAAAGIETCGDFLRFSEAELERLFGRSGPWFRQLARGVDPRPVVSSGERKSVSIEDTFARDLTDASQILEVLYELAGRLAARLDRTGLTGRTVTLKIRYSDFQTVTRSRTLFCAIASARALVNVGRQLITETEWTTRPVRLLGLGVSHLRETGATSQATFGFLLEQLEQPEQFDAYERVEPS